MGVISIQMTFKVMRLNEIIKKVYIERKEQRIKDRILDLILGVIKYRDQIDEDLLEKEMIKD